VYIQKVMGAVVREKEVAFDDLQRKKVNLVRLSRRTVSKVRRSLIVRLLDP
jgi:hypothetical protein